MRTSYLTQIKEIIKSTKEDLDNKPVSIDAMKETLDRIDELVVLTRSFMYNKNCIKLKDKADPVAMFGSDVYKRLSCLQIGEAATIDISDDEYKIIRFFLKQDNPNLRIRTINKLNETSRNVIRIA